MDFLIWLVVVAADIWALLNIWKSSEETITKVIWTIVIIVLPVIGLLIWWFAGPKGGVGPVES